GPADGARAQARVFRSAVPGCPGLSAWRCFCSFPCGRAKNHKKTRPLPAGRYRDVGREREGDVASCTTVDGGAARNCQPGSCPAVERCICAGPDSSARMNARGVGYRSDPDPLAAPLLQTEIAADPRGGERGNPEKRCRPGEGREHTVGENGPPGRRTYFAKRGTTSPE